MIPRNQQREWGMTDKKSDESRRKLLKSIAAGGGAIVAGKSLPENWKRPVVDSVMLPAHAETSPTPTEPPTPTPTPTNTFVGTGPTPQSTGSLDFLDPFVESAHAQQETYTICIIFVAGLTEYTASYSTGGFVATFMGTINASTTPDCSSSGSNPSLIVNAPVAEEVDYTVNFAENFTAEGTATAGQCTQPICIPAVD